MAFLSAALESARQATDKRCATQLYPSPARAQLSRSPGPRFEYVTPLRSAWDIQGQCDIRALTYVINSYIRRHDTYRSRFEFDDRGDVIRRAIADPQDIELIPVDVGEMTPKQWQDYILATPSPLEWDCFRFAIIQRDDHFTFCVSVDHLHVDAMFIYRVFGEIQAMYDALMDGGAHPAARCGQLRRSLRAGARVHVFVDIGVGTDCGLESSTSRTTQERFPPSPYRLATSSRSLVVVSCAPCSY